MSEKYVDNSSAHQKMMLVMKITQGDPGGLLVKVTESLIQSGMALREGAAPARFYLSRVRHNYNGLEFCILDMARAPMEAFADGTVGTRSSVWWREIAWEEITWEDAFKEPIQYEYLGDGVYVPKRDRR